MALVLAESSIELVPNEIVGHPSITSMAKRKGKDPHGLVLDQSYHHSALLKLPGSGRGRGRPDIAHSTLLAALGSPLNLDGGLECYVHTIDDHVITIDRGARLPKNTDRFSSLLEQLYLESVVPRSGKPLMSIRRQSLKKLLDGISADLVVALTTRGRPMEMREVAVELQRARRPAVLVGGFPVGHFSPQTLQLSSERYRIDRRKLEASTIVSRAIYDYERSIGLRRF